eukprot:g2109.t1
MHELHYGIQLDWSSLRVQLVLDRLKKHPDEASLLCCDRLEKYPLHCAVNSGAPLAVVQALVEAFPGALRHQDYYLPDDLNEAWTDDDDPIEGDWPLHLALRGLCTASGEPAKVRGGCTEVIMYLLKEWPDAARGRGVHRQFPLHLAAGLPTASAPRVVKALLEIWPEAAQQSARGTEQIFGNHGRCYTSQIPTHVLPLHEATANFAELSLATVKMLLSAYPSAATSRVVNGWSCTDPKCALAHKADLHDCLPIHLAMAKVQAFRCPFCDGDLCDECFMCDGINTLATRVQIRQSFDERMRVLRVLGLSNPDSLTEVHPAFSSAPVWSDPESFLDAGAGFTRDGVAVDLSCTPLAALAQEKKHTVLKLFGQYYGEETVRCDVEAGSGTLILEPEMRVAYQIMCKLGVGSCTLGPNRAFYDFSSHGVQRLIISFVSYDALDEAQQCDSPAPFGFAFGSANQLVANFADTSTGGFSFGGLETSTSTSSTNFQQPQDGEEQQPEQDKQQQEEEEEQQEEPGAEDECQTP